MTPSPATFDVPPRPHGHAGGDPQTGAAAPLRRRIRVLYVVAHHARWPMLEWISRELDRDRFDLSFVLMNQGTPPLAAHLDAIGVPYLHVPFARRSDLPRALIEIRRHLRVLRPDIVHAHFMNACLAGLGAAALSGVRARIHTRHHAGPLPWSHRPPWQEIYDVANNAISTAIIAPSDEARRSLTQRGRVSPGKVELVHHGFDLDAFADVGEARVRALEEKYGVERGRPVVGVVARHEFIKGIQFVIPAFERLLSRYPSALLLLANARGRDAGEIARMLSRIPAPNRVEVPFEEDVFALYHLMDAFVHAPIAPPTEGFGQVYVEAMAAGVPSVFTLAGVAGEVARHRENAIVVPHGDSDAIHRGLVDILGDPALRARLVEGGLQTVRAAFDLRRMLDRLETIYLAAAGEGGRSDRARS